MQNPSNHDLHIMLVEIKGDLKSLVQNSTQAAEWQVAHEQEDKKRFETLNTYALSILVSLLGACGTWIFNKVTGKA